MKSIIKKIIKYILFLLHIDITKNQQYDRQTFKIMRKVLRKDSNCIDVGCHKGEMLVTMLKLSPDGQHYAFEPIPYFYKKLLDKFKNSKVHISSIALSDNKGTTTFNFVKNAPAFSGLKQRNYLVKNPEIEIISVDIDKLDNIVPIDQKIDFIKIDVEGAEYSVMQGAVQTIKRCKPIVIFEFGSGASDSYSITPEMVYNFLCIDCQIQISTLKGWLNHANPLDLDKLKEYFENGKEYYFIAHK